MNTIYWKQKLGTIKKKQKTKNQTPQKIEHHKLEWKAEARTDTRNKTYTPPSKDVKKVKIIEP